ncbi:MAG: hypothetical protein HY821_01175 [Acidobacteria bacterium]|nr:hypothetical protein [Acidobacteriota bacterium]
MTQLGHIGTAAAALVAACSLLAGQETDYQVYTESPRLLLTQRRLKLLKRERERESMRWQQFEALMRGRARMSEPGFALGLWSQVSGQSSACREAAEWAVKASTSSTSELRQVALVYDWCQAPAGEALSSLMSRKLAAALRDRPEQPAAVSARVLAALAIADAESQLSQEFLKYSVETWWKQKMAPRLTAGENPFASRTDLYALMELLHAVRDNLRLDLREGLGKWFDELGPLQILSYYPQPWPAPENEYRVPAYIGAGEPNLREAALSRAAEMALVAFDTNAPTLQFLQGWIIQDRFLMRGEFGIGYEFLWANPYQPGLSFTYMPDLFHARGQLLARSSWDEDAVWFGFWNGQAQAFGQGKRIAVRMEARPAPVHLGPVRVFFASSGLKLESGWTPETEPGEKPVEEVAFILGLTPGTLYDVEVDNEEMFETRADPGGIVELRFRAGSKAGVRLKKSAL